MPMVCRPSVLNIFFFKISMWICLLCTFGSEFSNSKKFTQLYILPRPRSAGVASLIPARSHTFVDIDREIISKVILLLSPDSRRVVVSYKRKYVHGVLVNSLFKLAQEKSLIR